MAKFIYKARDIESKAFRGELEARDREDAMQHLSEQALFVISLEEKPEQKNRFVMKSNHLADFCKELSLMLNAGLPMVKAVNIIANGESGSAKAKAVYRRLHKELKGGMSLSDAMNEQGDTFPELIINMFYSGEVSGTMSGVANKMADYYRSDYRLRKKISQATMYPKILMVLTVGVVIVVFAFVLPAILGMLGGQQLPLITRILAGISDTLVHKWYNVLMVVTAVVLIILYLRSVKSVRYWIHKTMLKMYKVGPLLRIIYTARFARTLSSLYGSGVQLVTAISVSSKVIGNDYVERQFPDAIKRIKQGELLSDVVAEIDGFIQKIQSIIVIGEETGKLDDILGFSANSFEYDADVAINNLLAMLEPLLLVVMAVVIGTILVGVMLPIYQLYETIGGY